MTTINWLPMVFFATSNGPKMSMEISLSQPLAGKNIRGRFCVFLNLLSTQSLHLFNVLYTEFTLRGQHISRVMVSYVLLSAGYTVSCGIDEPVDRLAMAILEWLSALFHQSEQRKSRTDWDYDWDCRSSWNLVFQLLTEVGDNAGPWTVQR